MMDIDVIIVVDGDSLIQMQIWDVMASKVAPFDLAKYSYLNAYCPSSYGGGAQLSRVHVVLVNALAGCVVKVGRFRCLRKK